MNVELKAVEALGVIDQNLAKQCRILRPVPQGI
ncbi:Uncharacterised protein [Vibrio alginolyticus]|nr:Uncharacterised protein [Vibrio alginolyticus]